MLGQLKQAAWVKKMNTQEILFVYIFYKTRIMKLIWEEILKSVGDESSFLC